MQYTIGRLRGGFAVSWTENGKRRRFGLQARSRKEAEAEALDIIRRETIPVGGMTTQQVWDAYCTAKAGRPIARVMHYGKAVLDHFGHLRPDQISEDHCSSYIKRRRAERIKDGTIWTELGWLRTALVWAAHPRRRLIPEAPAIDRPAKPAPKDRWLTRAEVERLIASATAPHVRLAIILMLTTAGRIGAILSLKWDKLDFERRQIDLRVDADGPRKGRAVVPMNNMALAALQTAHAAALSDYVIEWAGGPVISIRKGFHTACEIAGLADVTPHTIRHCAARFMVEAGVPMVQVAQYLGHSNTVITYRVYGRFSPDALRNAGDAVDFSQIRSVK